MIEAPAVVEMTTVLLGLLHFFERAAARGARAVGIVEDVRLDDDAELLLLWGAVSTLRRLGLRLARVAAALGALAEEHPVFLLELRLEILELELDESAVFALRLQERRRQLDDARNEPAIAVGAGYLGITDVNAVNAMEAAASNPADWSCMATYPFGDISGVNACAPVTPQYRCLYTARAKRINVMPDAVELVWFDTVAFDDPMFAVFVASFEPGFRSIPGPSGVTA
jgi:hypothetical protein